MRRFLLAGGLIASAIFLSSCGGTGDWSVEDNLIRPGTELDSARVFITSVTPSYVVQDVARRYEISTPVHALDPNAEYEGNGDGECDPQTEICCSEVSPGVQNYQQKCCVARAQVPLCIGTEKRTALDGFQISLRVEPRTDLDGNPVYNQVYPVMVQSVELRFSLVSAGNGNYHCPNFFGKEYNLGTTLSEGDNTIQVSGVFGDLVDYFWDSGGDLTYYYWGEDGCYTPVRLRDFPEDCKYEVEVRVYLVEAVTERTKYVATRMSMTLGEVIQEDECTKDNLVYMPGI